VLLVEDERLIREVVAETLRDAGHDVLDVENGMVAVELMRKPPKHFTALVTDFHMPGDMDGSKVAARVRRAFPDIPVIIVSGRPEVLQAEWRARFNYHLLCKPYLPSDLVRLLATLVRPSV
jgi:CheY-like chemotaxis protein